MFNLTPDAAEIGRLEDALLRFSPSRQWYITTVTFPSSANVDLDIAHPLTPDDPERVGYAVLASPVPLLVYQDRSSTRTAWSSGVIRLRCTQPSAQVTLLLYVPGSIGYSLPSPPSTQEFSVGNLTVTGTFQHTGLHDADAVSSGSITSSTQEWGVGGSR